MTVRIAKKHTKAIAEMINTMECAQMFVDKYRDATSNDDLMRFFLWKYEYCRTVITLADEYGIVLPTLETSRINVGTAYDQYKHYRELVEAAEAEEAAAQEALVSDLEAGEFVALTCTQVLPLDGQFYIVDERGRQITHYASARDALRHAQDIEAVFAQEKAA